MNLTTVLQNCADANEVDSVICLPPWTAQSPAALIPAEIAEEIIKRVPDIHFCEIFAIKHFFGDEVFDCLDSEAVDRIIYFAKNDA